MNHRFFLFGECRVIWLPPCASNSGNCWVHHSNGGYEREHLKPHGADSLQEITEEQARAIDPEMFTGIVDIPFSDYDTQYPSYRAFYDARYEMDSRANVGDSNLSPGKSQEQEL